MVIVCGHNMGDIFRRNALNLGLQVVQSPEAVADAKDGDEFSFEPESRRLTNETQGKTYDAGAADAEGRRDPAERRHLRGGPPRVRDVGRHRAAHRVARSRARADDDVDRADRLGASRRQDRPTSRPARRCASTPICCPRRTAPRRSRSTRSTRSPAATRSSRGRPRSPTITSSSPARRTTTSRRRSGGSSRGCTGSRSRTTRRRATASSTSIFRNRRS